MHVTEHGLNAAAEALAFAHAEHRYCLTDREWRFRLQGYGYDIRQTERGRMLTTIIGGVELGLLEN